jgi:hypothetical protein
MDILRCQEATFPQTYLGLPLSNVNLPLSAFAPLIAKVDRYLAGWKALLLSTAGRMVLMNSMLAGIPTYAMGAMMLPPGVRAVIDARQRAFLWTSTYKASGAKCLVAWEHVCQAKEDGGLGIKRIDTQNSCLLIRRLHHPEGSAWALWAKERIRLSDLDGEMARTLGSATGPPSGVREHHESSNWGWPRHDILE